MKRKLPTILIMLVMALIGAMYWIDLSYFTDLTTGFVTAGNVWMRYAIVLLPLLMIVFGLRTIGPMAISVLRVRNKILAGVFVASSVVGVAYGILLAVYSVGGQSVFEMLLGVLFIWYGVWMFLCALQLLTQNAPSPTKNAIFGILACLPFCVMTIYRVLVKPTSLYRVAPIVRSFSALFAMLWFGMLLRALYISLPRQRVRWLYFLGLFCFFFATCLEFPQAIHTAIFQGVDPVSLIESINMGVLGLVAGCVSVAISGQSEAAEAEQGEELETVEQAE